MYKRIESKLEGNGVTTQTTQTTQSPTQSSTQTTKTTQTAGIRLTDKDRAVLILVHKRPELTQKEMALELGWTVDRVKYYLNKMKKQQIIKRVGSSHHGHWELLIEEDIWQS